MPLGRSFRKKTLARRLVRVAAAARDLKEPEVAGQILRVTELLLRSADLTAKERYAIAGLIVAGHRQLWDVRHGAGSVAEARELLESPVGHAEHRA